MSSLSYHRTFPQGLTGKYAAVLRRLPPSGAVLEVGCHTGYFSRVLIDRGYTVLAIESDNEAARAAAGLGVRVLCADVEDPRTLGGLGQAFDAVLLMDVLEHLLDPVGALQRLKPVISPVGRVIITGPNVAYWAVRKDLLLGRWSYADAGILDRTHLHFYALSGWRFLVESAGYTVLALEPAEGMLPLEHVFLKLPAGSAVVPKLRQVALRACPSLFTINVLIEATPKTANEAR